MAAAGEVRNLVNNFKETMSDLGNYAGSANGDLGHLRANMKGTLDMCVSFIKEMSGYEAELRDMLSENTNGGPPTPGSAGS